MTTDKPSKNEDEYFVRLESERIERRKREQALLQGSEERKSHLMRCPKCGGHLDTVEFHRIQVERCPDCAGIWLDTGEIDAVVAHDDKGLLGRVMGDLMGSLKGRKGK